jgi:serine/threonine protein kinase
VRTVKEVSSALLPSRASRRNSVVTHSLIDDFVVGKFLGEGRFGTVHQVFHKGTGAIFAMKKIPKENVKKLNMVNQLIKELKIQTYLHHKNIVALYHSFDDANYIYLLMEYMEQGTLFSQLKKKKVMPENEVAKKIKEVSSAVKYLHEN